MSDDTLLDVLIIGAGLGGVGTAAQLIESGYDNIAVIEAADSVGGVWRQHRYPNIACDTPIDLYAYSFYPGTSWSTNFAPGSEILAYLRDLADRYGVTRKTVFNTRISQATWNDDAGCWRVTSRDGRTWAARMLIWSGGLLSQPTLPEIKGLDGFEGQSIHTSFWNDDIDLDGKRVAVVGGGATSIQVVPYAAKHAEKLYVLCVPLYVMPRPDISLRISIATAKSLPVSNWNGARNGSTVSK